MPDPKCKPASSERLKATVMEQDADHEQNGEVQVKVPEEIETEATPSPSTASTRILTGTSTKNCPHLRKGIRIAKISKLLASALTAGDCSECLKQKAKKDKGGVDPGSAAQPEQNVIIPNAPVRLYLPNDPQDPEKDAPQAMPAATREISAEQRILWICLAEGRVLCPQHRDQHAASKSLHSHYAESAGEDVICLACVAHLIPTSNSNQLVKEVKTMISNAKLAKRMSSMSSHTTMTLDGELSKSSLTAPRHCPGLTNLGNTCFFNSVMQCLSQTTILKVHLRNHQIQSPIISSLRSFFAQMADCDSKSGTVNPRSLFASICTKYPIYANYRQQDAHELLRRLLDICHSECDSWRKSNPGIPTAPDNIIEHIFGGKHASVIVCDECGCIDYTLEDFLDISCPVNHSSRPSSTASSKMHTLSMGSVDASQVLGPASSLNKAITRWEGEESDDEEDFRLADKMGKLGLVANEQPAAPLWSKPTLNLLQCLLKPIEMDEGSCPSKQIGSVASCIWSFLNVELLSGENLRSCDHCFKDTHGYSREARLEQLKSTGAKSSSVPAPVRQVAYKRYLLLEPPRILVVHLKRFVQAGYGRTRKLEDPVKFAETLDLSNGLAPPQVYEKMGKVSRSAKYRLYGVVCHSGSLLGGHYIAYVSPSPQKWVYCSDSHTRLTNWEEVSKSQPYILFYEAI